jgi:TRAP-type C4-dicarboxylate transport system substrate-binding protein
MQKFSLKTLAGGLALGLGVGLALGLPSLGNAAEFTFKLHHFAPPKAPTNAALAVPWAKRIEKASGGRIKIDVYPSMQLGGKPPQLIQQVKDGVADIVWTLPGYSPGRFLNHEVFELPFMHTTTYATNMAMQDFMAKHGEEYKDIKVLMFHVHAGQVFHSVDPIRTADDLAGHKVRTPTRTGGWVIEALGSTPIGVPVPKIPEMLTKKIVDTVIIPYEIALPLKVHEMVDNHMIFDDPANPRINTSVFLFAMNKAKYDALPADLKKVIDDNSGRTLAIEMAKVWDAVEVPGEAAAKKSGTIYKMPLSEVLKVRAKVEQPVIDRWKKVAAEKGVDGQALIDEARGLIAKYSK